MDIAYTENPTKGDVIATFRYQPDDAPWAASGDLKRGESGLVIAALTIHPDPASPSGVTGGLIRKVQVGELLSAIRAKMTSDTVDRIADSGQVRFIPEEETAPARRGGRAALTDDLLRDIAATYLVETGSGMPPGALKRMAEQFDRPEETIRTWVARARRDGWLGPSVKGRAGAEPGPRLIALLPPMRLTARMLQHYLKMPPEEAAAFVREQQSEQ